MLAVLVEIGADGEHQSLHKRANLTCRIAVINGRAKHNDVGFAATLQDGAQVIFQGANAIRFRVLDLAGKTTLAALEINVVEVHQLAFCSSVLSTLHGTLQCLECVPLLSWATVNKDSF